jgi:hypothetical protein
MQKVNLYKIPTQEVSGFCTILAKGDPLQSCGVSVREDSILRVQNQVRALPYLRA